MRDAPLHPANAPLQAPVPEEPGRERAEPGASKVRRSPQAGGSTPPTGSSRGRGRLSPGRSRRRRGRRFDRLAGGRSFSPPARMSDDPHGSEANAPKVADPPEEMVTSERSAFDALNSASISPTMTHPERQCRTRRRSGDSPSNTPILRLSRISSTTCSSAGPAAWGGPVEGKPVLGDWEIPRIASIRTLERRLRGVRGSGARG